ncbi:hypothetical protein NQ317_001962 [Molorchus minor]|uniref:Cuticle protein 6 n=1 Tax=Molorchus minor TaxID=1323400 RepID=A0ABQ9JAF2_9CUCU|nr:hypothetical protein NQ317_001962 [Molorchus minor]
MKMFLFYADVDIFKKIKVALASIVQTLFAEEVRLLDLEPSNAQQILGTQDQSLHYAPKIESSVPAVRYLGREPHHVLEDIYLARQYHGQDGLGGYLYGYNIPDIAKTERKRPDGDLRGAYNYIAGNGQEIKVQYWDDGTGFHQIDNVPLILPKQVDDSPEVKAAKAKFFARWNEEAQRNSQPISDPYDNQKYDAHALFNPKGNNQIDYTGQYSENQDVISPTTRSPQYQQQQQYQPKQYQQPRDEDEDTTGPPRGFFYSYDYPVGIIVKEEGLVRSGELKDVYNTNRANLESRLARGAEPSGSSQTGYLYVKK